MATIPDLHFDTEETENPYDEKRTAYLDIVRDNISRQGQTALLYRVVVCGEIGKEVDKIELGSYYQRLFKQFQNDSELITGMLLCLKSSSFVHVIEASRKVVLAFLRDFTRHSKDTSSTRLSLSSVTKTNPDSDSPHHHQVSRTPVSGLHNIKVLLVADDASTRQFPFWASRAVEQKDDLSKDVDDAVFSEENIDQTIADICVQLSTLGTRLSSLNKNELKTSLDELGDKYRDVIPQASLITTASKSKDIISITEWLEVFDGPAQTTLESELVWPVSNPITIP